MKKNRIFYWIIGLLGLSMVVVIHEFGHFSACKWFNVGTPVFSVGFGPSLISTTINNTKFQLAALPLGGYVTIDPTDFDEQSYTHKLIIMIAGIIFNLGFAFIAFVYLKYLSPTRPEYSILAPEDIQKIKTLNINRLKVLASITSKVLARKNNTVIGPIGIINLIGKSLALGFDFFLFTNALLSVNIAIFNLLPIPFFDGGQIAMLTISTLTGPLPENAVSLVYFIFMILLIVFVLITLFKDVSSLRRKK